MDKRRLPILVLKNIILFPHSEIRIEVENESDKELISLAESYYNKHILIIYPEDELEESIDKNLFPRIGIIGYISMKLDLPNNKTRIVIKGLNRVNVTSYIEEVDGVKVSTFDEIKHKDISEIEQTAYTRSLIKQINYYTENVPNVSNSVMADILGVNNISKVTDLLAMFIPNSYQRKLEYINEIEPTSRVVMLLDDISKEVSLYNLEKEIDEKVNKNLEEEQKKYVLSERVKVIKEEIGEGFDKDIEINKLKEKSKSLYLPDHIKKRLDLEIKRYEMMPPNSSEVGMIRTYIDTLLSLPFNKYTTDNLDINKAKEVLDNSHFGLNEVKSVILEYLSVNKMTNGKNNPIICLVGPPGVGKTSFAKSIANALGRKFTKISVGGVTDEAEIVGHRRAYIGSAPGKIITGLKKAGSSNPVFVIDEIDKMSKDIKGDPASSLLEVLDKEQNKYFEDHYLEEEYDLSHVMFVLTANYVEQIPLELIDRLEIIEMTSYTEYEKFNICKNYIIPKGLENNGLENDISFTDDSIYKIIRGYTKEAGVRELERLINKILRKIVKRIISSEKQSFNIIDSKLVEDFLGLEKYTHHKSNDKKLIGVVNAMSYTIYGGDILRIEVSHFKGKGDIITTGSLGEVFIESAKIALSYIKSNYTYFNIDYNEILQNDIHLHVPEGAVKKDGPSAGTAICTAIISTLSNLKVNNNISMTGEITLRGDVLPVGGLKEKIIGAKNAGIKKIFAPYENKNEIEKLEEEIKSKIKYIYVKNYKEIYDILKKEK